MIPLGLTPETIYKTYINFYLAAPTGELLRPVAIPETAFNSERGKLRGMNETVSKINVKEEYCSDQETLKKRVYEVANVSQVPCVLEGRSEGK